MVTGRAIPLPARRPVPELVPSSAQPQQEQASALPELCLPELSRRSSASLRHEPVPAPSSIDSPGRWPSLCGLLPFRAPRQPTVLGVPFPYRFDRLLVVGGAHGEVRLSRAGGQDSDSPGSGRSTRKGSNFDCSPNVCAVESRHGRRCTARAPRRACTHGLGPSLHRLGPRLALDDPRLLVGRHPPSRHREARPQRRSGAASRAPLRRPASPACSSSWPPPLPSARPRD
jgi:hypothetical protein